MSIQQQAFGAVSSESVQFAAYPNSGILGMAFSTISVSGKPTFFENLIKEEKVVEPLFSVHLERGKEVGSEVCFGCYDQSKTTGKVYWVPLVSKTYWPLALDSMSVNGTSALADDIIAVIDTGTTLIYIPEILATKIYELIPGSKPAPEYGPAFYTFPCDGVFTISLSFGGRNFAIHSVDFNLGPIATNSLDCVGGILSLGQGFPPNLAIVGDEFLKSWYSTFDHSNGGRVGFSPSINNKR
ncbi:hypothetical protein GALMADRAFT_249483 [Galerina marginata CBS 339.88]|uniref:Peptidase A1 domain-containing protein n=1 Tax=Galerina marginata (strain CBS 339.88) TaxID=685588 RepID=A0A067T8Z1_GALM3|nr:hypothetical protein GALMADRAFT_249483 [Galerina marginata CBS 339.88]